MPATADVAFAGIQYIQRPLVHDSPSVHMCALHACLALQWAAQVQRLAGYVANEGGLSTRVHLWTPCVREADAATIFQGGPPVLVHNRHDPELEGALRELRERQPRKGATNEKVHWKGKGLFLLLKWSVVGLEDARLAVFLDLDMEVMPRGLHPRAPGYAPEAPAAREWLRVLRCANQSGWALLSLPDHSSPVNTALLVLRPNASLYREGVAALQRGRFNRTHGWDLVGPPSVSTPALDDSLSLKSEMRTRDDWSFVCASLDQGFFFYMMRIRAQQGADLGRVCSLEEAARKGHHAKLRHYAGGAKPDESLSNAARCVRGASAPQLGAKPPSGFWRLIRPAPEPKVAYVAKEIARSLSWGERTRALAAELLGSPEAAAPRELDASAPAPCAQVNKKPREAPEAASGGAPPPACTLVRSCLATLRRGLRCLRAELDHYNVTLTDRRRCHHPIGGELRCADVSPEALGGAAFLARHFPEKRGGVSAAVPDWPQLHFRSRRHLRCL